MYARFLLRIWVLHKLQFRLGYEVLHIGKLDEVVDAFSVVLQMEARILERIWQLNHRLSDIVDLLL